MAAKRRQEEKHLETLKKIQQIDCNKKCLECDQRGPTYVDVTIGSFVCTSCGGILRGLNPPHRVKSVSMATFTQTEIAFIQTRGNEYCKNIYLGKYDERSRAKPESKSDHGKLKYFMEQKYEQKKWYIPPEQAAKPLSSIAEDAKKANEIKPLSSILGNNHKQIQIDKKQLAKQEPQKPPATQTDNILADFGSSDAFGSNSQATSSSGTGFADFNNAFSSKSSSGFDAFGDFTSGQQQQQSSSQPPGFGGTSIMTTTNTQANTAKPADKYADLADLFSMDNTPTPVQSSAASNDFGWSLSSHNATSTNTQMNSLFGMSPPSYSSVATSQQGSVFPNMATQQQQPQQQMPFTSSHNQAVSGFGGVQQSSQGYGGMQGFGMATSTFNAPPQQQHFMTSQSNQIFPTGQFQQSNFGVPQQQQPFANINPTNTAPSNPFMQTAGQTPMQAAPMQGGGNPFMVQQQNNWSNQPTQKPFPPAQGNNPFMAAQAQATPSTNPFF